MFPFAKAIMKFNKQPSAISCAHIYERFDLWIKKTFDIQGNWHVMRSFCRWYPTQTCLIKQAFDWDLISSLESILKEALNASA